MRAGMRLTNWNWRQVVDGFVSDYFFGKLTEVTIQAD